MVRTRSVPAGEFKSKCLALLDEVRDQQEEIVITKHGRPVARLVPLERPPFPDLSQMLAAPLGDIETPLETEWDADR